MLVLKILTLTFLNEQVILCIFFVSMENYGNSSENKCIDHCASQSLQKKTDKHAPVCKRDSWHLSQFEPQRCQIFANSFSDSLESCILYVSVLFVCDIF